MQTFSDAKNQEWTINLDAPTVLRVRSETCSLPAEARCTHRQGTKCDGIDLADPTGRTLARLGSDLPVLGEVLWSLVKSQSDGSQAAETEFLEGLCGDVIDGAATALETAIFDLFPAKIRDRLLAVREKEKQISELAFSRMMNLSDEQLIERATQGSLTGNRN